MDENRIDIDKETQDLFSFIVACDHNPHFLELPTSAGGTFRTRTITQQLAYISGDESVTTALLISREGGDFYYLAKCFEVKGLHADEIDCLNTHFMMRNLEKQKIKYGYDPYTKYICIVCNSEVSTDYEVNRTNYLGIRETMRARLEDYDAMLDQVERCKREVNERREEALREAVLKSDMVVEDINVKEEVGDVSSD